MKRLKQLWTGQGAIRKWLASGGQLVPQGTAYLRTVSCVNCPQNKKGGAWDAVTRWFARRVSINRKVSPHLYTCQICGCALRLKVQLPLMNIILNTPDDELAKFPAAICWISKEINA